MDAAADLIAERGVAAVSLDDVCHRALASRSQLYHYFQDKNALDAISDTVLGAQGELLESLDSWTGLNRWFNALVELQRERQGRGGCPIGSLAGQLAERDPQARAAIAEAWPVGEHASATA